MSLGGAGVSFTPPAHYRLVDQEESVEQKRFLFSKDTEVKPPVDRDQFSVTVTRGPEVRSCRFDEQAVLRDCVLGNYEDIAMTTLRADLITVNEQPGVLLELAQNVREPTVRHELFVRNDGEVVVVEYEMNLSQKSRQEQEETFSEMIEGLSFD